MRRTALVAFASIPALVGVAGLATRAAADTIARGAVVQIEAQELYLNLGSASGVVRGARLRLKRPVKLKHPISHAWISDWIPLGSATVTSVGGHLSMAVVAADLVAAVAVGDIAEIYVQRDEVVEPDAVAPPTTTAEPLPAVDEATGRVLGMWQASATLSLDGRIATWERFLTDEPDGPHAEALRQDLAILRAQREAMRVPKESLEVPELGGLDHVGPRRVARGADVPLRFLLDDPASLATGWLHVRPRGHATYQRVLLQRENDLYLRGEIPADAVRAPGVEYFVEIATTGGELGTALGSPERPLMIEVGGPPLASRFGGERKRSQVALRTTYTDFASLDARAGDHADHFVVVEADVAYQVGETLRAIRAGAGSVQGEGGFADRVYSAANPAPEVGFNYGYAEAEVATAPTVGVALRAIIGVGQEGFGGGFEGRLRLGHPSETNLSLGVSRVSELGFLSELKLEVPTVEHLPLAFAAAVTDQPNQGELGVRLSTDLGWRVTDWMTPTVRISYQARTAIHAGLGAGLGLVMGW